MNSSLAAVAETDYQPFTPPFIDRQRKVLSVRNLSKSYSAQQTVLDSISFDLHAASWLASLAAPVPESQRFCTY